jgi:hypothetical protein
MCCGGQTDDKQPRIRITESRQRLGPIFHAQVAPRRVFCRSFTPADKTRAAPAFDYRAMQVLESYHETVLLAQ